MQCPSCGGDSYVTDTRLPRRRRVCVACQHRWTTYEVTLEEYAKLPQRRVRNVVPIELRKEYRKLTRAGVSRDEALKALGLS